MHGLCTQPSLATTHTAEPTSEASNQPKPISRTGGKPADDPPAPPNVNRHPPQVDPTLSRTVLVSTKLDTRIPQFATPSDVEMHLAATGLGGESAMLGGAPFFTWGRGGGGAGGFWPSAPDVGGAGAGSQPRTAP